MKEEIRSIPPDASFYKYLDQLMGVKATRGEFMIMLAALGITGTAGVIFLLKAQGRKRLETGESSSFEIYPGWIEASIDEKNFVNFERGHSDWLKAAVFSNPPLFALTSDYYRFLLKSQEKGKRLTLGEALCHSIAQAHDAFREAGKYLEVDQNANLGLEATRLGILAFAAGFMASDWWKLEDLEKLGVPKQRLKNVNDFYWGENGLARDVFPKLFTSSGERETEPKKANTYEAISGQDRAVHFAQHLAITFEYLYSKQYGLLEEESIPNLAKLYVGYSSSGSIEANARAFSDGIGRFYEVSALKKASNWPFGRDRRKIVEGPFDLEVDSDYKGNRLGAEAAIALFSRLARNQSIEPVLEELSDPRFQYTTSEPVLRSS